MTTWVSAARERMVPKGTITLHDADGRKLARVVVEAIDTDGLSATVRVMIAVEDGEEAGT